MEKIQEEIDLIQYYKHSLNSSFTDESRKTYKDNYLSYWIEKDFFENFKNLLEKYKTLNYYGEKFLIKRKLEIEFDITNNMFWLKFIESQKNDWTAITFFKLSENDDFMFSIYEKNEIIIKSIFESSFKQDSWNDFVKKVYSDFFNHPEIFNII